MMNNEATHASLNVRQAVELLQGCYEWNAEIKQLQVKSTHVDPNSPVVRMFQPPYAMSDADQYQYLRVHNPLWEIIRWMPTIAPYWGVDSRGGPDIDGWYTTFNRDVVDGLRMAGLTRQGLCLTYAFAIITPGDLEWFDQQLGGRPVIELGAGRGYWASQLEQIGVDIVAYEPHTPGVDNEYMKIAGQFTPVRVGDHTFITEHQDRALLMVWPPYGSSYPAEALRAYTGDTVIYCGEGSGGCTADDDFYELLERKWKRVSTSESHITYSGIHCDLSMWRRR